jgi:hypothetical protein
LAAGDAAAKRKLRLELAGNAGSGGAAAEIRKRLVTIARSRSFVDWHKSRAFAKDLETQREAIIRHVAPGNPAEALDLIWRFLDMAPSIYERCDDSNGTIGGIMDRALVDLARTPPSRTEGRGRVVAINSRGTIREDDFAVERHGRLVRSDRR